MTRQLLSFARKQTLEPRATNLTEQLEGLRRMLTQRTLGDSIELKLDLGEESLWCEVDQSQLNTGAAQSGAQRARRDCRQRDHFYFADR